MIVLAIAAALLIAGWTMADDARSKPDLLHDLTSTPVSRMPERASRLCATYPDTMTQLELDLIAHRWVSRQLDLPPDIRNRDAIVSAMQKSISDPAVSYASETFALASRDRSTPSPDPDNVTIQHLANLKARISDAIASRESSPAKAAEALVEAAGLSQEVGLDLTTAAITRELGDIYHYDMSSYIHAESFYHTALDTFRSYRCAASTASVYDAWGTLSMALGRYADSVQHYTDAARQWLELINEDPSQSRNRDRAGLAYMRAGEAAEANGDYTGALELMRTYGRRELRIWSITTKSYDLLVSNLITIAEFVQNKCKSAKEALDLLDEAGNAARLQNDPLLQARVYEQKARVYASQNTTKSAAFAATARQRQADLLRAAAAAGDSALAWIASQPAVARKDLAEHLALVKRSATAYGLLARPAKSAELWKKAAAQYEGAGMIDEQISCLRSLAVSLDELKRPNESIEARIQAVTVARKNNLNLVAADIIMSITRTYREQNQTENALEGLNELVDHSLTTRNSRQAAEALEARGSLRVENGAPAEAIDDFKLSLDKFTNLVGDVWAAGRVALELARAQAETNQLADARTTLSNALAAIESSTGYESYRLNAYPEHTKITFDLYRTLVESHVRANDENAALAVLRRATLRAYPWFSDLMRDLRQSPDVAISRFARGSNLVGEPADSAGPKSGSKALAKDGPGYVVTCYKLQQSSPASWALLPVDPLQQLYRSRNGIPENAAVITYLPADFCVYAFVCSRGVSSVYQLDGTGVAASLAELRQALAYCEQNASAGIPVPAMIDWQSPAFLGIEKPLVALYTKLVAPLSDSLIGCTRLVFAMPREYEGLPTGALIAGRRDGAPEFLIQQYEISYLAKGMMRDLSSDKAREIYPALDSLAMFADPEDNLPGARKEAAAIRNNYLNSRWYVGSERATATNLLSECDRAGIIHIAAHHRISASSVGFEIILAQDSTSDGVVGIRDLMATRNDSLQLVVLSACDTVGSSDPISAGPSRAAEAFSLAGAKSVLGSMWKVSDDAAPKVFAEFYKNLSKGKSRAESLRLAQQSMIESKRFAHPFYWACFALYGNPR
jgi:tetratricopeptide (TPR) repeat protein